MKWRRQLVAHEIIAKSNDVNKLDRSNCCFNFIGAVQKVIRYRTYHYEQRSGPTPIIYANWIRVMGTERGSGTYYVWATPLQIRYNGNRV